MQHLTAIQTGGELQAHVVPNRMDRLARSRTITYVCVGAGLTLCYIFMRGATWQGTATLHTVMEALATLLALTVAAMALVRFYSKKNNTFLFVGAGFLGTAFLDGYHAIVTSAFFKPFMPSDLPALIPWSWVASRQFLSVFLFMSFLAWLREQRLGDAGRIGEGPVYMFASILTLVSFVFFAFAPLPRAYYPEFVFHRPEEFIPALFFLGALAGYLRKGDWQHDIFEHWLVLSLIVGFVGQAVFMSFSGILFDLEFDAAHTLKKVSYVCVLIGLLASMYAAFRREAERSEDLLDAKKKMQSAILDLESHKQALDAHAIVAVTDTKGKITFVNDKFCEISKYDRDELIGSNHRILSSGEHPKSFFGDMYKTVANGRSWHGEIKNRAKDGSHYWVDTTITPIKNAKGKIVQYVAIRADITDRKLAEEEILIANRDLQRSNVELSHFATIASHDLQEPLRNLQAFCGLLQKQFGDDLNEKGQDYLSRIHGSSQRMETLIKDLLSYSRVSTKRDAFTKIDLNSVANHVIEDLRMQIDNCGATIQVGDLPTIDADPLQMRQLLQNLIGNAVKYRREDTAPFVTIDARQSNGTMDHQGGDACDWFQLVVKDNGIGFDNHYAEKIFGVFHRLHGRDTYEGTGVGLAICRKIVEQHGGNIGADGIPDEGATITVTLPQTQVAEGL